jgi:hypothetical protein
MGAEMGDRIVSRSVALTDEAGDMDLGGWSEGWIPRVDEEVELQNGKRYTVSKVRYRLTGLRILTAFVFLKPHPRDHAPEKE